jgi:predicted RNA-binding protein with PIN domain
MQYLVDGHNLIPKAGLRLDAPDDEMDLVTILQEFSRTARAVVEVYFDGAPQGQARTMRLGMVVAHFVELGTTADAAIKTRLQSLGRGAKNWTIVTSDREIQQAARNGRAKILSAESFARQLATSSLRGDRRGRQASSSDEPAVTEEEIERWLEEFGKRGQ